MTRKGSQVQVLYGPPVQRQFLSPRVGELPGRGANSEPFAYHSVRSRHAGSECPIPHLWDTTTRASSMARGEPDLLGFHYLQINDDGDIETVGLVPLTPPG